MIHNQSLRSDDPIDIITEFDNLMLPLSQNRLEFANGMHFNETKEHNNFPKCPKRKAPYLFWDRESIMLFKPLVSRSPFVCVCGGGGGGGN
jgi:hypothetical protein